MASSIPASGGSDPRIPGTARSRRAGWRKAPLLVWASAAFMMVVVLAAICAPLVAPYDPTQQSLRERLKAPTVFPEVGRQRHLLGTDQLGRDILSRIIYGSRVSLIIGFSAVFIGGAIGGLLGLLWGTPAASWTKSSCCWWTLNSRFRSSSWRSASSRFWAPASGI